LISENAVAAGAEREGEAREAGQYAFHMWKTLGFYSAVVTILGKNCGGF